MNPNIKSTDSIFLVTDDESIFSLTKDFFYKHDNLILSRYTTSNISRSIINESKCSLAIFTVDYSNWVKERDILKRNIELIKKLNKHTIVMLISNDPRIIHDNVVFSCDVDDILLYPCDDCSFGFRVLVNLSRYKHIHHMTTDVSLMRQKYDAHLSNVRAQLEQIASI